MLGEGEEAEEEREEVRDGAGRVLRREGGHVMASLLFLLGPWPPSGVRDRQTDSASTYLNQCEVCIIDT